MVRTGIITGILLTLLFIAHCTPSPRFTTTPSSSEDRDKPKRSATRSKQPPTLSARYKSGMSMVGVSSYYGTEFHGKLTANGETFDMYGISAAHRTLPFDTLIRVTNLTNNRSILVRVNDRGPFIPGRILDLSYGAARKLGFINDGTTTVKIEIVELGDGEYRKK